MQQQPFGQEQQFNPFRQSMMMPQQTGLFIPPQMTDFSMAQHQLFHQSPQGGAAPFGQQAMFQPQPQAFIQPQQTGFPGAQQTASNPFKPNTSLNTAFQNGSMSQPSSPYNNQSPTNAFRPQGPAQIQRPGSTPAFGEAKSLAAQPTGTKNPFAPAPGSVQQKPAEARGPSMNELAFGSRQQNGGFGQQQQQSTGSSQQNVGFGINTSSPWGSVNGQNSSTNVDGSGMSDVASAFTQTSNPDTNDFLSQFGSMSGNGTGSTSASSPFGSISSQAAGASSPSKAFLQPQPTGYGGSTVKRFQPSSTFGSQLLESLPPIAASPTGAPGSSDGQVQAQQSGFPGMGDFGRGQGQGQGQGNGGLQPQPTGVPNPFRGSTMFAQGTGANHTSGMGGGGAFGMNSPFAGQNRPQPTGGNFEQAQSGAYGQQGAFGQQQVGAGAFGQQGGPGTFGMFGQSGQNEQMQAQGQGQRQTHSLI